MRSAIVVYRSHSGVTRRYGEAIAAFLATRGLAAQVVSVGECDTSALAHADYVLLGCWTSGLFVVRQRPDEPWLAFVRDIPDLPANSGPLPKVALFTTYKLRTGQPVPEDEGRARRQDREPGSRTAVPQRCAFQNRSGGSGALHLLSQARLSQSVATEPNECAAAAEREHWRQRREKCHVAAPPGRNGDAKGGVLGRLAELTRTQTAVATGVATGAGGALASVTSCSAQ
jgi:flavodoxin